MTQAPSPSAAISDPAGDETLAAVDLGSNSFHLIVARQRDGELQVLDRLREMVRLAGALDDDGQLVQAATAPALACLERFGQRLRDLPAGNVRAVGTNTLRRARNAQEFLTAAEGALGHTIEVISGLEEARIIYLGVAASVADTGTRRLVIDIGGGSTELIIGERLEPLTMESLYIGCVNMSARYFADGAITRRQLRRAEIAARIELEPHQERFRHLGWGEVIGSSGTIRAVEAVIRHSGWSDDGITCSALERLVDAVLQAGQLERLRLPGLGAERGPVFAGGLAVLLAAFDALGIDHMRTSEGALREGLLYDLGGRIRHEDVRARTVAALAKRHQLDSAQAARVEQTAAEYFSQVASEWALTGDGAEQLLRWAAQLHELGLVVAHSQYHKHGSYLLENADLPGFSRQEQRLLAVLVRTHRRKYSNGLFKDLPNNWRLPMQRLAILLRLAVLLHRSRSPEPLPPVRLQPRALGLTLYFPPQWLEQHPLTCADLEQEAELLRAAGFELVSCQTAS